MKKVKEIITRNKALFLILILVIISIPVILYSCSKDKRDRFVGTWYKDGVKDAVITKKDGKYEYQTYIEYDGEIEKGILYKDGCVKEKYLLFEKDQKTFYAFEYKNDKEITMLKLYRPDIEEAGKPLSKARRHIFYKLKRLSKDD